MLQQCMAEHEVYAAVRKWKLFCNTLLELKSYSVELHRPGSFQHRGRNVHCHDLPRSQHRKVRKPAPDTRGAVKNGLNLTAWDLRKDAIHRCLFAPVAIATHGSAVAVRDVVLYHLLSQVLLASRVAHILFRARSTHETSKVLLKIATLSALRT